MAIEIARYSPPIPQELNIRYRTALSEVLRWQGGTLPSTTIETNMDHVDASLEISQEIERTYPRLALEVNFPTVNDMIYLHDAGEIITGDLCLSRPDIDSVKGKHKHREKAAMRYLIGTIDDEPTRTYVDKLARRYLQNSQADPEGLTARLVDKIQALDFGLENVYSSPKTNEEKIHAARAIELIESVVEPLSKTISPEAQDDLDGLVIKQWGKIKSRGFII